MKKHLLRAGIQASNRGAHLLRHSLATRMVNQAVPIKWPSQVLLRGKRAKQRIVPLAKDTAVVLRAYLEERRVASQPEAPVFVNARGRRLSRFGAIHILRQAVHHN